jgi:hypothetical protein
MLSIGREVGSMLVVRNANRNCGVLALFFDRVSWFGCTGLGFGSFFGFGSCVFEKHVLGGSRYDRDVNVCMADTKNKGKTQKGNNESPGRKALYRRLWSHM